MHTHTFIYLCMHVFTPCCLCSGANFMFTRIYSHTYKNIRVCKNNQEKFHVHAYIFTHIQKHTCVQKPSRRKISFPDAHYTIRNQTLMILSISILTYQYRNIYIHTYEQPKEALSCYENALKISRANGNALSEVTSFERLVALVCRLEAVDFQMRTQSRKNDQNIENSNTNGVQAGSTAKNLEFEKKDIASELNSTRIVRKRLRSKRLLAAYSEGAYVNTSASTVGACHCACDGAIVCVYMNASMILGACVSLYLRWYDCLCIHECFWDHWCVCVIILAMVGLFAYT